MITTEEDIEWELDEGVPQFEDPFIQKYLNGRDALIDEEHKKRHGRRSQPAHNFHSFPFDIFAGRWNCVNHQIAEPLTYPTNYRFLLSQIHVCSGCRGLQNCVPDTGQGAQ